MKRCKRRTPSENGPTAEDSTVYVIDDDAAVRASIQGLLNSVGLGCETFGTAQEFLLSKRRDRPSCLVLDVRTSWSQRFGFSARVG